MADPVESRYPALESFVEVASAEEVAALLQPIREALGDLKGGRAEQGKKALKAVERTEELLSHLLQVREHIEGQRKGKR
jgi:hypothetical protein